MSKELDKDIDSLQKELEGEFGKDSIQRLNSPEALSKVTSYVSTGSIIVDKLIAGTRHTPCSLFPFGRQTEVAGRNGSGKTTLVAQIARETQKAGGIVTVVDAEDRIDEEYWSNIGVDTGRIINIHAESIEEVFRKQMFTIDLVRKQAPDRLMLMIWDSVGSTSTETIRESDDPMGGEAMLKDVRVIGHGMKVINQYISQSKVGYLYTNHVYRNVGGYGPEWISNGGEKLQYFATLRLLLTKSTEIVEEDDLGNKIIAGQRVRIRTIKNSMAPKRMEMEAIIYGGSGFNNEYSMFELAGQTKKITKAAWSTWVTPDGEEVKFQGFKGFMDKVVTHKRYPDLVKDVLGSF